MFASKQFTHAMTSTTNHQPTEQRGQTTEQYVCISLLGEVRVWLEREDIRIPVPIRSYRRQELLAYIATVAPRREQRVSSSRIITDVFEHIAPRSDADNLRGLFQKHTQLLRKEVNEVASEMNFPRIRLFQFEKIDNSSTKWWLSDECKIVDLTEVKIAHKRIEEVKEEGDENTDILKDRCEQLIRLYQSFEGDYLEKHLLQDDFGDTGWVREPFTEYRDMYLEALWDAAIAEHNCLLASLSHQDRYRSAKKAASLYRAYALYSPKNRGFAINVKKNARQSERALQGYLKICNWLMDAQAADHGYALYGRLMRKEFPEWRPDKNTVELLQEVRQQSGKHLPLVAPLIAQ
jgi:hypothetical protein